jgi:predicted nucleic acid-binding protein
VADSSFYICFLGDVERPDILIKILQEDSFDFFTGPIIKNEIHKRRDSKSISDAFEARVVTMEYHNYGEIVRPLFSLEQMEKGEHEVFVISYIFHSQGRVFVAVLDDEGARSFLESRFPKIFENVRGTIGFLVICTIDKGLFSKEECTEVLELIKKSKFRARSIIIDEAIAEVGEG